MAGIATLAVRMTVTGIGDDIQVSSTKVLTVPVEAQKGYVVVETATTTAIQLFDFVTAIALAKIYGVYIKAEVGTIYLGIDTSGTGTITSSTADLILNTGEATYLPINPDGNLGLIIDAAAITDAFSYIILGKA